jgi:hypothetical protein
LYAASTRPASTASLSAAGTSCLRWPRLASLSRERACLASVARWRSAWMAAGLGSVKARPNPPGRTRATRAAIVCTLADGPCSCAKRTTTSSSLASDLPPMTTPSPFAPSSAKIRPPTQKFRI